MAHTIHRNFKQTSDAESARNALLADGFPAASVTVNPHSRPGTDAATQAVSNVMDALTPGGPAAAAATRERLAAGALLSVDVDDDEQREQADAILRRFGAVDA
ncbi:hypothetical protein ACLB1G_21670 [Oxalobacteraceae bacterium A2-2]